MERVQNQLSAADCKTVRMLTRQFRMSKHICNFISDSFYRGRLIMDEAEGAKRMPEFVPGGDSWLSGIFWLECPTQATHVLQEVRQTDGSTQIQIKRILCGAERQHLKGFCEETVLSHKIANATEAAQII